MRRGALLKDDQNIGISPMSVGGGEKALGNCDANVGFCGPGSVALAGLPVVLIAPCGGWAGVPQVRAPSRPAAVKAVTGRGGGGRCRPRNRCRYDSATSAR